MPVRVIRQGHRGVRGRFPSRKAARVLSFESRLERDHFLLLEADPGIRTFEEQPVTIAFTVRGKARRYTPDVRVEYEGGRTELVEVKYAADLASMAHEDRASMAEAHDAARAYAAARGWTFRVATDVDLRGPRLDRAETLRTHARAPADLARWSASLSEVLRQRPGLTLGEAVAAVGEAARPSILHLLWLGALCDDMTGVPSDRTRLWHREERR